MSTFNGMYSAVLTNFISIKNASATTDFRWEMPCLLGKLCQTLDVWQLQGLIGKLFNFQAKYLI